jgi:CRP/FNR family transcriptional regulator, cyclic AMP receptor protein
MKTLHDIIADQAFFRGLSQEHLRTLADNAMQTWFESDELVFHEGDLANRFYLIIEGKVALESSVKNGDVVVLQTLGPGDLLGWSWLFSPYVWRLHARAVEPTEAVFFYGTRLSEQCEANHDLGYELFKRVSEVMMQRLQIARGRFLDHLATCGATSSTRARTRSTAAVRR